MAENSNTPARVTKAAAVVTLKTPSTTLHVAKELARFIKENKLSSSIQGKEFVQVEGWQYAGTQLGIIPKMGLVEDLSTDTEIRFRATVSLYDLHNKIELGGGVAECSNKERTKKFYESYAICSMAQTRAVGKAYRNVLAWVIKAAGFEATPYEEMTDVVDAGTGTEVVESPKKPKALPASEPAAPASTSLAPSTTAAASPDEPAPMAVAPESKQPALAAQPTPTQVTTIKALLNNPVVTGEERSKTLAGISKMDQQRAAECISNLETTIRNREQQAPQPAPQPQSAPKSSAKDGPMSRHQREDLINLTNYPAITAQERSAWRMEIGNYSRAIAEERKKELRAIIAERTPDKQPPAELPGEKFERVARELLQFTRTHQDILGEQAYKEAYLHVQGITVTAAELESKLQAHRDEVEAQQVAA